MITARITDLIKLCHREQEGERVSAWWFHDIRSALQWEVQFGLEEAMANSLADDGWTKEQWEQILKRPGRSGGGACQCDALRQGMRQESFGKGTSRGERVASIGNGAGCQTGTSLDCQEWHEAAAGRRADR